MERLTKREIGGVVLVGKTVADMQAAAGRALNRLAAYEDTGLTPEEIELYKEAQEISESMAPERLIEISRAEKERRLVVVGEEVALAMSAGARAILTNKRLQCVTYVYDCFGELGGPKEISYFQAAKVLREIGYPALATKEAEEEMKKEADNGCG